MLSDDIQRGKDCEELSAAERINVRAKEANKPPEHLNGCIVASNATEQPAKPARNEADGGL